MGSRKAVDNKSDKIRKYKKDARKDHQKRLYVHAAQSTRGPNRLSWDAFLCAVDVGNSDSTCHSLFRYQSKV